MFILLLLNLCYINGCISKMCLNKTRSDTKPWNCCDNHEEINGICVACSVGYFSEVGEPCWECPNGLYGAKCVEICKCKDTESCHHIVGCILKPDTTVIVAKDLSTVNDILYDRITNATNTFLSVTSNEENKYSTGSSFTSVTSDEDNSFPDLSKREVVVYSIGIGGFTCLLLLLFCRGRYTLNTRRNRSVLLESESTRNDVPVPVASVGYTEGVYETIDESNMLEATLESNVPITVETTSSDESTNSELSNSLHKNEYLNPYQPMVPDPERHVYDFATDFTEDYSGLPESKECNFAYCNPSYQQTVPYYKHQNVLSIQANVDSSGSSTSDDDEKDNEYKTEKYLEQMEYDDKTNTEEEI